MMVMIAIGNAILVFFCLAVCCQASPIENRNVPHRGWRRHRFVCQSRFHVGFHKPLASSDASLPESCRKCCRFCRHSSRQHSLSPLSSEPFSPSSSPWQALEAGRDSPRRIKSLKSLTSDKLLQLIMAAAVFIFRSIFQEFPGKQHHQGVFLSHCSRVRTAFFNVDPCRAGTGRRQ